MKKLVLLFILIIAGFTANAQYTPYNQLNYIKLLQIPPAGLPKDSVLVFDSSDKFVKMRPLSTLITKATPTKSGIVKTDVLEADPIVYTKNTLDSKLEIKTENSSGALSGFLLTDNGNGTVNIASGVALLRSTNSEIGVLSKYTIPAVTNLALTDNANNFVLVNYNAGTPSITVTTDPATINTTTNSLLYVVSRVGNVLNHVYAGEQNVDSNGKLRRRFLNIEPITRAQGAAISFTNRNISVTAGLFYAGLTPYTTPLLGATFTNVYNNASVWTRQTAQTLVNNTQYNVNGVLTTMNNGRFRVDYVYLLVNNPSQVYTVMGSVQYNNLADARLATLPSLLPVELQRLGVLVGRLIIEKDAAAITEVSSAYDIRFNASTVINHNDTGAIQGGAVGDYQHVTTSERNNFHNPVTIGTANGLSLAGQVLSLGLSSSTTTGALSGTDWNTFNGKANANGSNASGTWNITSSFSNILNPQIYSDANQQTGQGFRAFLTSTGASNLPFPAGAGIEIKRAAPSLSSVGSFQLWSTNDQNQNGLYFRKVTAFTTSEVWTPWAKLWDSENLVDPVTGTGTTNFLSKWTSTGVQGNSQIFDNGTNVGLGTSTPSTKFHIVDTNGGTFFDGTNATYNRWKSTAIAPSIAKDLLISAQTSGNTPDLYINTSGIVLLGSTSGNITDKLQITGSAISTAWKTNGGTTAQYITGTGSLINFDSSVRTAVLTGFTSGAGTVSATDNVLQAINKLDGNDALKAPLASPTFTGSVKVPNATLSTEAVNKGQLDAVARPYKVYVALLTQTGANAPTATVLENTLGGTVTYTYISTGIYEANLSGVFTTLKTTATLSLGQINGTTSGRWGAYSNSTGTIRITTLENGLAADGRLLSATLEIRVYN